MIITRSVPGSLDKKEGKRCHLLLSKRCHLLRSFWLTNPALLMTLLLWNLCSVGTNVSHIERQIFGKIGLKLWFENIYVQYIILSQFPHGENRRFLFMFCIDVIKFSA
jgi:hypothetical protein